MSRLSAALDAADRGWPVFPLRPGTKRPRRQLLAWEDRATIDAGRIERWWRRHPADNVAIATGPARLVVVDLDVAGPDEPSPSEWPDARTGASVYNVLAARHGGHRPTWTVATPSCGWHLYFQAPATGGPWRNTAGRIGWHIDTRAGGGYVVAAGSLVAGRFYVTTDDRPPAALPTWIAERLAPVEPPLRARPIDLGPKGRGYASAALDGEVRRVLEAPVGQRNAALNRAAWSLARHISSGLLDRGEIEDALTTAGRAAGGQTAAGVAATIRSAIDARLRQGGEP